MHLITDLFALLLFQNLQEYCAILSRFIIVFINRNFITVKVDFNSRHINSRYYDFRFYDSYFHIQEFLLGFLIQEINNGSPYILDYLHWNYFECPSLRLITSYSRLFIQWCVCLLNIFNIHLFWLSILIYQASRSLQYFYA